MAKLASIKPARSPVSRSGLWLIGGTLLLSLVVLAWAFQEAPPGDSTGGARPAVAPRSTDRRGASVRIQPRLPAEQMVRSPSVADYGPLLQRNVFRPLVTREASGSGTAPSVRGGSSAPAGPSARGRGATAPGAGAPGAGGPETTGTWRGWQFNGVAQLDQNTYALMDQPGKKRSRFVKQGDRLEDATIARIAEDRVILREMGGSVVYVQRHDVMADLLRPSRSGTPRGPAAPAAGPAATPAAPAARSAPVATTTPNPETPRGVSPPANVLQELREARRARRQQRQRETGPLDAGENPAVSED